MRKRILVFRLSSLGDLILSTAFLESLPADARVDWVVSRDFAPLLRGHPKITSLLIFDRSQGFLGWVKFVTQVLSVDYDSVIDLHASLRTRFARVLGLIMWLIRGLIVFLGRARFRESASSRLSRWPKWYVVPKQVFRTRAYFLFRKLWPKSLRPTPWAKRYAQMAQHTGLLDASFRPGAPSVKHLLSLQGEAGARDRASREHAVEAWRKMAGSRALVAVMPSSRWASKAWPVERYVNWLERERSQTFGIVVGTSSDQASHELLRVLAERGVLAGNAVASWTLADLAWLLTQVDAYVGNDTGLAHLAEAVGTPAGVIFGPTHPEAGFGPRLSGSAAIGVDLFCRPCGKDGRFCQRFWEPRACLTRLSEQQIPKFTPRETHL